MRRWENKTVFIALLLIPISSFAQVADFTAAKRYDAPNLEKKIGSLSVIPFFFENSSRFWFVQQSPQTLEQLTGTSKTSSVASASHLAEVKRTDYFIVDPVKKLKTDLFDKVAIERQLRNLYSDFDPAKISYNNPNVDSQGSIASFDYGRSRYDYHIQTRKINLHNKSYSSRTRPSGDWSPDLKWVIYAQNHNLFLRKSDDTLATRLSSDGARNHSFSINPGLDSKDVILATDAKWTADSRFFYAIRKDTRKVKTLTVINSLTAPRPYVNTYPYELPGDKEVTQYELFIGEAGKRALKKIDIQKWPDQEVSLVEASDDNKELFLLRKKRSREEMELCAVDFTTGQLRVVISEISRPFINHDLFNVAVVNSGKDIIWWSDRSGWGQYYHYNGNGVLTGMITRGNWTAAKIIAVDTMARQIYFYGYGREKNINPNYAFVYRADFGGSNIKLLTPENATHTVFITTDKKYLVDNFSRIDLAPKTVVRDNKGSLVMEIMKPDLKNLYEYGWKAPEQFVVKAKDGLTDLYGLMWKPFNFDPSKKYPIISQVYPGPQIETVWSEFTVLDRYNNTALAQIGFIVVVMGHRGGTPTRDAKYYKYGYGNLRDYALEDDKFGLEQLAARYQFIDSNRVGIFGHSGGGMMATAAICTYPDFYKVAVSSSGNHDNTIYNRTWGETYQGSKAMSLNQSLAKNLKGHLLMVAGESDANVNPASTMRMADALIKADKQFDMLILPGQGHSYEEPYKHYFQEKTRMYFASYLLPLK